MPHPGSRPRSPGRDLGRRPHGPAVTGAGLRSVLRRRGGTGRPPTAAPSGPPSPSWRAAGPSGHPASPGRSPAGRVRSAAWSSTRSADRAAIGTTRAAAAPATSSADAAQHPADHRRPPRCRPSPRGSPGRSRTAASARPTAAAARTRPAAAPARASTVSGLLTSVSKLDVLERCTVSPPVPSPSAARNRPRLPRSAGRPTQVHQREPDRHGQSGHRRPGQPGEGQPATRTDRRGDAHPRGQRDRADRVGTEVRAADHHHGDRRPWPP